jgi:FkbM family methyltransferase
MLETTLDTLGPLRQVLTESISAVKEREASALDQLLREHQNRVVIFGCGGLGQRAIEKLRELGVQPLALCDNNEALWGTAIQGIPVFNVQQAAARFGSDALFLVAVWNPHHWYGETEQQLKSAGVRFVTSYAPMFWRFPQSFLPVYLLNNLPTKVYEAKDAVLEAENLWADDISLRIYRANIRWRALGEPDHMPSRPPENTYFPVDIFNLAPNECILDCGAYDGDTVKLVLDRYESEFAAIYPIEGDAVSFEKLRAYVAALPLEIQNKIHPIACAVGGTRTVVRFTSDGSTGAKRNDNHNSSIDVQCYPLDDIPIAEPVTLIKMDIEGAEYETLMGARTIIAREKPLLAVCVYHAQDDIWRIPLLIRSMLPEHSLFLRAYEGDGFQTVVYAVPKNRCLPGMTNDKSFEAQVESSLDPLDDTLSSISLPDATPCFKAGDGVEGVVILGCGYLGKFALEGARRAGLNVLAFADNNQTNWGQRIDGIEVMSPQEAIHRFNDDAFFVVAIYNGTTPRKQLAELNCKRIVPYPLFFWRYSQHMPFEDRLELPHRVIEHPDAIRAGYALLSDAKSRLEFAAQIRWRCSLDYECLPKPDPADEMYYPPDLFSLSAEEVLVDCGAFDGDSIRMFLERTHGRFRHIYAIEPDAKNRAALDKYLTLLPGDLAQRISVLPFGLSDCDEVVSFSASGTVGSRVVAGSGSESIQCRRLDGILDGPSPTLIKMDIEGAEPRAIPGAATTIRASRPILAICAYHKCEHLWTLPVIIKNALPEYEIFLRRYAEECWETVYYAIPPDGLRPEGSRSHEANRNTTVGQGDA